MIHIWQSAKQIRRRLLRAHRGDQQLDLILRFPRSPIHRDPSISVEDVLEEDEGAQAEATIAQVLLGERELRQELCPLGPPIRRTLGQSEVIRAEHERAGEPHFQRGTPPLDLRQVAEELDEESPFLPSQLVQVGDDLLRRLVIHIHFLFIHRENKTFPNALLRPPRLEFSRPLAPPRPPPISVAVSLRRAPDASHAAPFSTPRNPPPRRQAQNAIHRVW